MSDLPIDSVLVENERPPGDDPATAVIIEERAEQAQREAEFEKAREAENAGEEPPTLVNVVADPRLDQEQKSATPADAAQNAARIGELQEAQALGHLHQTEAAADFGAWGDIKRQLVASGVLHGPQQKLEERRQDQVADQIHQVVQADRDQQAEIETIRQQGIDTQQHDLNQENVQLNMAVQQNAAGQGGGMGGSSEADLHTPATPDEEHVLAASPIPGASPLSVEPGRAGGPQGGSQGGADKARQTPVKPAAAAGDA